MGPTGTKWLSVYSPYALMIPLIYERVIPYNYFKIFGLKTPMIVFSTNNILPSFEKYLKSNQVQKTKVNHTIFWLWIKNYELMFGKYLKIHSTP